MFCAICWCLSENSPSGLVIRVSDHQSGGGAIAMHDSL